MTSSMQNMDTFDFLCQI